MRVIMVMVSSVNGKITRGDESNIHAWTSTEDQHLFASLVSTHTLIVMGRKTYEVAKSTMKLTPGKRRVVLTTHPEKYIHETIENQLEFTGESPKALVDRLTQEGYTNMLLVGGSEVNALFAQDNLIDEIYLTIEPILIGEGSPLIADRSTHTPLQLIEMKQLNKKGTLLMHYNVQKNG